MTDAARPRTAQGLIKRPSKLAVEASLLKPSTPLSSDNTGMSTTAGLVSTGLQHDKLTRSAVRFDDAKQIAAKESFKKQKQAWDSPTETPRHLPLLSPLATAGVTGTKKIQDFLYPSHLRELRRKFENGPQYKNRLNLDGFIEFFHGLPEMRGKSDLEIKSFFDKIDCYSEGNIDWDEFCTYMYLELYEKEDAKTKAKEVVFSLPATPIPGPHKDSLCCISHLQDGSLVSCSQDGIVCFWTHDLKPKRVRKTETGILGKPKWISDMTLAIPQGKVILTTGDSEIQFFEMINFEPYCQISNLNCTPLKVDFWSNPDNISECLILVGDEQGSVTIISISNIFDTFKRLKLGPKKHGIPSYPIEELAQYGGETAEVKIYRWHLHSNWVTNVRYFGKLRVFVSTSNDSNASLVMGSPAGSTPVDAILHEHRRMSSRPNTGGRSRAMSGATKLIGFNHLVAKKRLPGDQRIFSVSKGVTTFDYCQINNVLVTGGMDQVIYIWNPYVSERPIGTLYGQGSPVFCIRIDSTHNRIYSISNDNTIKVWDLIEQTCLSTVSPAAHRLYSTVEALHFNSVRQYLVIATDQLHVLNLSILGGVPKANVVQSHRLPVSAVTYSYSFSLVITACEESVVKVWDVMTGECVFEFASVHGSSPITAIDLDHSGRRLVTGAQNGEIKIWNFNNGHCLLSLEKGNCSEVTDVKFVSVNQLKYVIAVGWDRSVNVFFDSFEPGDVQSSISPIDLWTKSSSYGHNEDITSITLCQPTTLATASFNGEIILWNMVSGQLVQRLRSNHSQLKASSIEEGDCVIHRLLFLETRKRKRTAASLVSSGPAGFVHFWNIFDTKKPMGLFQASQFKCVTDMTVDTADSRLVTADIEGFITEWDIAVYCIDKSSKSVKCIRKWRAHANTINSISLIEEWSLLATASSDCSVRLWTLEGHFIGTFGHKQIWDLANPNSYQHPLAPKDVLFDPLTIPSLPDETGSEEEDDDAVFTGRKTPIISDLENDLTEEEEKKDETILAEYGLSFQVPKINTPDLGGKRLRHLRNNSAKSSSGYRPAKGTYASLLYQELDDDRLFHTLANKSKTLTSSLH